MFSRVALRCSRPAVLAARATTKQGFPAARLAPAAAVRQLATETNIPMPRGSKGRKMNLREPRGTAPVNNLDATFTIRVGVLHPAPQLFRALTILPDCRMAQSSMEKHSGPMPTSLARQFSPLPS